ncbi:MAG: hypothetical protein GY845_00820 [Planctomycetes bacterium]|nr:hypothetical protein [Planctomycetota bacterium]
MSTMEFYDCPNCSTKRVLPLHDGRCPNCKGLLVEASTNISVSSENRSHEECNASIEQSNKTKLNSICEDENHQWDGCKCKVCGMIRDVNHRYSAGRCWHCGQKKTNNQQVKKKYDTLSAIPSKESPKIRSANMIVFKCPLCNEVTGTRANIGEMAVCSRCGKWIEVPANASASSSLGYSQYTPRKHISRFHPIRILLLCGVNGLEFTAMALVCWGFIGLIKLLLDEPSELDKHLALLPLVLGIAFIVGCINGARKI